MMSKNKTSKAVSWALLASATAAVAMPVLAADNGNDVERIEVTGSRIKRTDMETASPVSVISAKDLQASGYTSVADVLADSTFSAGAPTGAASNNGGNGASRVDLRGLGSARTLVLVNGRRMVNSGTGADSSVDLSTIPVGMIERIEVLKDGASAVYGSDAVAGVVNIITKKDFQGLQVDASYGGTSRGDANTGEINLLMGGSTDKANVVIGASYVDRGLAKQSNRGWSDCAKDGLPDGACGGGSSYIPGGSYNAGDGYMQQDASGNWVPQTDTYNYIPYQYLYTPQKRTSLFGNGSYQLTDNTQLFSEFLYTKRMSNQQLAPSPVSLEIPAGATGNPENKAVTYKRRMTDAGTRGYEQTVDTTRYVIGAQGYLDIHNGLDWDVSYTWGRNDSVSKVSNLQNTSKILDTVDPDKCGGDSGIPCANWFVGEGQLSQDVLDYVDYTDQSTGGNEMNVINANISGDLFELPAGMFSFASGIEYRREKGWFQPDSVTVAGDSAQSQQDATAGSYDTKQIYAEFAIPVLSDKFLVKDLSIEAAARYFDYSTFGSDSTWKLGLTWRLNDDFMLRGVRSTAFRAPTVSELYGGSVGSFDYLDDPCSDYGSGSASSTKYQTCNTQIGNTGYKYGDSQIETTWTSDPNLKPEKADTLTLGAVWSPSFINGFSATLDYYKIEIKDAIDRIDAQEYLNNCYNGDSNACSVLKIERSANSGDITYMSRPLTNIGNEKIKGVDLDMRYAFDAAGLGWTITWDTSYLDEYTKEGIDYADTISGDQGAYAKWKHNASLALSGDSWDAKWTVRYIDGMHDDGAYENGTPYTFKTDSVVYNDLSGSYHFNDSTTVTLGVDNVFDEDPAYVPDYSDANTVPEAYDVLGRYVYAKLSWRI
ncbi:TonB-dependent receptor [Gallaecimonas pentaromativorans]|uniref:Iron complex outermembrane receptor protein n=1 Tax=Gallaecimonas pentaromativorans TaxID=584787 RepID=A0A3N1PFC1_9GAMM|nr:TonB-dependent receptor [Gallaecimonas pentaromativorans]MED5524392.1 TonB-dependent receptor [Pseudomonadota bacterium]ROQ30152.1 iron complex outermembrane receptor protein [Gallaecimonas pentaromativorans]